MNWHLRHHAHDVLSVPTLQVDERALAPVVVLLLRLRTPAAVWRQSRVESSEPQELNSICSSIN